MPIYNGELRTWVWIISRARSSYGLDCSICGGDVYSIYIQHPISGFVISLCESCLKELPNLFPDQIKTNTDLKPFLRTVKCNICERNIAMGASYVLDEKYVLLCENCYCNRTWVCWLCHHRYSISTAVGDSIECSNTSHNVCSSCCEREDYLIKPYDYNPKFKSYKTNNDKKTLLYFGIELEVEDNDNSNKSSVIKSFPKFVYVKSDSSISNGFEIVSHPMTYKWLENNANKWNKMLVNLRNKGYCSYNTSTCGIHIHLSKAAFGNFHLYKFMKMFYDNESFILYISQRSNQNALANWANTTDAEKNIIHKAKYKTRGCENRHTAINLSRENSVEIRIFRGTLHLPSFWKNIEFAKALYDFSRDFPLGSMNEIKFRIFIRFKRKEFPNLYNFMWATNKDKYAGDK